MKARMVLSRMTWDEFEASIAQMETRLKVTGYDVTPEERGVKVQEGDGWFGEMEMAYIGPKEIHFTTCSGYEYKFKAFDAKTEEDEDFVEHIEMIYEGPSAGFLQQTVMPQIEPTEEDIGNIKVIDSTVQRKLKEAGRPQPEISWNKYIHLTHKQKIATPGPEYTYELGNHQMVNTRNAYQLSTILQKERVLDRLLAEARVEGNRLVSGQRVRHLGR